MNYLTNLNRPSNCIYRVQDFKAHWIGAILGKKLDTVAFKMNLSPLPHSIFPSASKYHELHLHTSQYFGSVAFTSAGELCEKS